MHISDIIGAPVSIPVWRGEEEGGGGVEGKWNNKCGIDLNMINVMGVLPFVLSLSLSFSLLSVNFHFQQCVNSHFLGYISIFWVTSHSWSSTGDYKS